MSDEFFLDDDVIISFDDNMIEEVIPNVSVVEQRFKEDSILRLNQDQIKAEVTNLIIDKYNKSSTLKTKVANYTTLFFQFPHVSKIHIKQVKPIIYTDKLTFFTSDDDHIQNKEYEKSQYQKSEKLSNFISQFHSINRDMSKQSSLLSSSKLYALYAPFSNREDDFVKTMVYQPTTDEDALRHCFMEDFECPSSINDTVRLISKVSNNNNQVYDGDYVNIIGFYNLGNPSSSTMKVFDVEKYLDAIDAMQEGDKVTIIFNSPAFSKSGSGIVKQIQGTVTTKKPSKLVIHLSKDLLINGEVTSRIVYDNADAHASSMNPFYIYPSTVTKENIYTKQYLQSHNVIFKLPQKLEKLQSVHNITVDDLRCLIAPCSTSEVIMQGEPFFKDIHNLQDLNDLILKPFNIDINTLTTDVYDLIKYIISYDKNYSRHLPSQSSNRRRLPSQLPYHNTTPLTDFAKNASKIALYDKQYPSLDTFIDNVLNRYRYLKSQNDKGAFYFLSLVKSNIQKKYKKHITVLSKYANELAATEKALDALKLPSSSERTTCEGNYAKEYKKLDKLLDDNNKNVYYDKKYDKTDYKLKEGFTGSSKKEMKLYLLNELTTLQKYKGYSKDELDFEINAIVEGKRPVQFGDMCILHTSTGDVVYSRKMVEEQPMWIKKFRTPYKICTDNPLMKFDELIKLDTCIKQTFDDICSTNRNAKILHKYKLLVSMKTELSSVLHLLESFDSIIEILETDIEHYNRYANIIPSEHKPDRKFEYVEHVDYETYHGDEGDVNDVDYIIQYEDQSNFVTVPSASMGASGASGAKEVLDNQDILNMLLSFLQLDIEENEKTYILNGLNAKHPRKTIAVTLQKYQEKFMGEVNKDAYKTSEKYMKMFDNLVKQKLDRIETELMKKYYYNVFRYTISMIIILVFVRYPNYIMKRVHPSCVKFLSYIGYPVSDKDPQKSLVAYMACILVNISVPEDIRFAMFYDKDNNEIQKVLRDTIDEILEGSYELRTQLELTKLIMKNDVVQSNTSVVEYNNLTSFKPRFKFANTERMSKTNKTVVKFVKSIQQLVSSSKVLKQNGLNVPNLSNACCNERLVKDTDFFNFFETNADFKSAKATLSSLSKTQFVDENLHPPHKREEQEDLFAKYNIQHQMQHVIPLDINELGTVDKVTSMKSLESIQDYVKGNDFLSGDNLLGELVKNHSMNDWWNDIFYPTLMNEINDVETTIQKVSDRMNKDELEYVRDVIVNVNSAYEPSTVRHALHMFLSTKLKLILGKILNKQKLTETMLSEESIKTNPIYAIIASVTNNKNFDALVPKLKHVLDITTNMDKVYVETDDNDVIVKNISVMAYITFVTFKVMLLQPVNNDNNTKAHSLKEVLKVVSPVQKDNVKIVTDIIAVLVSSLSTQLKNTIIDNDALKMSVEALREKRKQELIDSYKVDEEERELQKQLKKLGLDSWADILTGEDDIVSEDVQASNNVKSVVKDEYEEEKDYVYSTYKGENADDDEVDEDYISYESYDD
jgi:hypothetical protein